MIRLRCLAIVLGLLQGWAVWAGGFDHGAWDALLKRHVVASQSGRVTQVDYAGMGRDRTELKHYLDSAARVTQQDFDGWNRAEQLAFLLNLYNAWTAELILTRYPDLTSIKELGSLLQSPWKRSFIPLLGETRSLDDIEHGLIRGSGRYRDPRIHFAANCASVGCPALRPEAYLPGRLEEQLEEAAQRFLADRSRNRLEGGVLKVSSIFKWYRQDFEGGWRGAWNLGSFLALYGTALGLDAGALSQLAEGGLRITFLDYDWRLNAAAATASP